MNPITKYAIKFSNSITTQQDYTRQMKSVIKIKPFHVNIPLINFFKIPEYRTSSGVFKRFRYEYWPNT